jgi:hypothetical protein
VERLGLMPPQIDVPEDFDQMGGKEVEKLFDGTG